jgi:hypothetical protein
MISAEEEESRAMKLEYAVTLMLDKAQNPTMISCEEEERFLETLEYEHVSVMHSVDEGTLLITRHGETEQVEESCAGASIPKLGGLIRKAVPELSPFTCRQVAAVLEGLNAAVSLMWRQGAYDPRPIA